MRRQFLPMHGLLVVLLALVLTALSTVPTITLAADAAADAKREAAGKALEDALAEARRAATKLAEAEDAATKAGAITPTKNSFRGIHFGIGLGVSGDFKDGVIRKAEVIDDTVRVTEQKRSLPRVLLESHYFITTPAADRMGVGPFVAIQTGSNEIIEAISMGVMVGWRRTSSVAPVGSKDRMEDTSFNFAFGVILDSRALVLRDGIRENAYHPAGQGPLTRETSRKLPRQVDSSKLDSRLGWFLGRNVRGGTWPRLSCGRSVL